jgi:hypothetical protein
MADLNHKKVRKRRPKALMMERCLARVVNAVYGLTPEDVELLWGTAPPQMPVWQK